MDGLPVGLIDSLFFVVIGVAAGYATALYAWEATPSVWGQVTQRKRYSLLAVGVLAAFVPIMVLASIYGPSLTVEAVEAWWNEVPLIGYLVGIASALGVASPLLGLLVALRVYYRPTYLGKRVRGGWIPTSDMRSRTGMKRIVIVNSSGQGGRYHLVGTTSAG